MSGATVGDIGELALIDLITDGLALPPGMSVGVGDDAAVFTARGDVAVSTDAMVEDVHFRRAWSGPHDVGRKAVASAVADLEAMAARPRGLVVSLIAPPETPVAWVRELARGVRDECGLSGAALVGGDLSRGAVCTVVVTVFGDMEGRTPVLRSGARPGDVVACIGRLGMAQAGLTVLTRGFRSPGAVVRAHRVPEPPYGQGIVAHDAGATSLIDCSDGPLLDLGRVARASRVRIDLNSAALDVSDAQKAVAAAIGGGDPLTFILSGGDDHALFATFPSAASVPQGWLIVGRVLPDGPDGEPGVTVDGEPWEGAAGWQH